MTPRSLHRHGLMVSPLGFGAFKIGRNQKVKYAKAYDLPDERAVSKLLNGVLDLGITLIDTAPAYGLSEERIGKALSHRRHEFVISTKVGESFEKGESRYAFDAASVRESILRSLGRLQTDVLDVVLIHTPPDDVAVLTGTPVVETLQSLKAAGHIRAIGLSGKTVAAAKMALTWADVLMVEFHLHDTSHQSVIADALAANVGVIVKKGLASGNLPPAEAIPFVLNTPGVRTLVIGGLSLNHIAENVRFAESIDQ